MADNITTQTATLATIPNSTIIRTMETASGHVQLVLIGGAGTCTTSSVGDSATNVTVLAANTDRVGASFYNDSTSAVSVKMGATASSTSFQVRLSPGGYFEMPFGYTGIVDAIWDVDAGGSMRVGEYT